MIVVEITISVMVPRASMTAAAFQIKAVIVLTVIVYVEASPPVFSNRSQIPAAVVDAYVLVRVVVHDQVGVNSSLDFAFFGRFGQGCFSLRRNSRSFRQRLLGLLIVDQSGNRFEFRGVGPHFRQPDGFGHQGGRRQRRLLPGGLFHSRQFDSRTGQADRIGAVTALLNPGAQSFE